MGQYKVPQDVEAEDKLIGPLSLRQFIYIVIGLTWAGLMWRLLSFNVIIMLITIIPVTGFFILLGVGRRQEQSFENYFIALIRFIFVPRIRVWQKDTSTETVVKETPKKAEVVVEKSLPTGSLQKLALIMDTRGNYKDPTIQLRDTANPAVAYTERILDPSQLAQPAEHPQIHVASKADDVLDEKGARNTEIGELLENIEAKIHNNVVKQLQKNLKTSRIEKTPTAPSQPQTPDAILKKAVLQGNNLTVEQLARHTKEGVLQEDQEVLLRQ